MNLVRIYHPKLPGQHSDVPDSALPHWSRSGWTTDKPDWVVEQEQQERAENQRAEKARQAPETSGASLLERSPRRRRHTEEGES